MSYELYDIKTEDNLKGVSNQPYCEYKVDLAY